MRAVHLQLNLNLN